MILLDENKKIMKSTTNEIILDDQHFTSNYYGVFLVRSKVGKFQKNTTGGSKSVRTELVQEIMQKT